MRPHATFALLLLLQTCFGQFKGFNIDDGAFRLAAKPVSGITGKISLADGGVVFRVSALLPEFQFSEVNVVEVNDSLYLTFVSSGCMVSIGDKNHTVKDAAMMVAAETDSIYRLVSLYGEPQDWEDSLLLDNGYWLVEVEASLIGTKSGETLLKADLIQTDLCYYATDTGAAKEYLYMIHCIQGGYPNGWTYHDEDVQYMVQWDCEQQKIYIDGAPHFTFVNSYFFGTLENEEWSQVFLHAPDLINDLNPDVFNEATSFARLSAFYRSLKSQNEMLWQNLLVQLEGRQVKAGITPRYIQK